MAALLQDLRGKINNTRLGESKALWPLFEAVVNSIQSLEDVESDVPKEIGIFVQRQETDDVDLDGKLKVMPFESFTITDNGLGFTSENYKSLDMS